LHLNFNSKSEVCVLQYMNMLDWQDGASGKTSSAFGAGGMGFNSRAD